MPTNSLGSIDLKAGRDGSIPTDDDLFWLAAMRQVQTQAIAAAHWAAAGVLAASLAGWILVAAALIYGATAWAARATTGEVVLWIVPLVLWTLAALWALRVFSFRRYRYFSNSPDSAQQAITRIARKKTRYLHWAIGFWTTGALALIVVLILEFTV